MSTITAISMSAPTTPTTATSASPVIGTVRIVRFDNECVLIPEPLKRPKMVTKSYSLPLWKRKPQAVSDVGVPPAEDDNHVVLKVPLPSFMSKSRSPPLTLEPAKPLSPCLVHRSPSSSSSLLKTSEVRQVLSRRPSLPLPSPANVVTIPLRECCSNCEQATEKCLKEGEDWEERFSRGALRRRSSSLDASDFSTRSGSPPLHRTGFAAVACHHTEAVVTSSFPGTLSITVDEVDKRRKSYEFTEDEAKRVWSNGSTSSSIDVPPKSSPIPEEDEDELFPLPSPRRSPSASPSASPIASPAPSLNASPAPSPNASTSHLNKSGSRETLLSGSEDSHIRKSLSRRHRCDKGLLTPAESSPSAGTPLLADPTSSSPISPVSSRPRPPLPSPPGSDRQRPSRPLPAIPKPSTNHTGTSSAPLFAPPSVSHTVIPSPTTTHKPRSSSLTRIRSTSSASSSSSHRKRHPSFPSPSTILKAGVEVLKGVSSISGSPGGSALTA